MPRLLVCLVAGGLFGAGLLVSGMADTVRVQGWLDVFGDWDPTLAFVLGGAILPMALAWRVAARRRESVLGLPLPAPPSRALDPGLIIGSALFGMGWALAGLCPGPALASLSFGGGGGVVFLLAMSAGMLIAPRLHFPAAAPRSKMDIRALTPSYAVSPQIDLSDLPAIKAAGFTTVIDNRPDREIPDSLQTGAMRAAAEAQGLTFVAIPLLPGNITDENIAAQAAAVAASAGPVFAYCASGNRCSQVWAMMNAGRQPTNDLIAVPARFGYQLEALRDRIDALAAR
jgi:uncharacterized protein (TIGR01244 family)